MGGCKCTYRNCKVKSDGQTHMFHYPVFDKLRCHKWLTNGQRLEFLDLKVSQLRNRVVCQHHFTPDSFMNYKMDKLKFDAVPCLNGPYCDAGDEPEEETSPIKSIDLATMIGPEDIDNDQLNYKEKEANLPVKYADFLMSSDISPVTTTLLKPAALKYKENDGSTFTVFQHCIKQPEPKKSRNQPTLIVTPYSKKDKTPSMSWETPNVEEAPKIEAGKATDDNNKRQEETPKTKTKKRAVKIISEKKIFSPITFSGTLEPVSPSLVIRSRDKPICNKPKSVPLTNFDNVEIIIQNAPEYKSNDQQDLDPLLMQYQDQVNQEALTFNLESQELKANMGSTNQINEDQGQYIHHNNQPLATTNLQLLEPSLQEQTINSSQLKSQSSPKVSVLKSMIPPERVAAIEEKRNFNKKLRDMIEFCLEDDREKYVTAENKVESNSNIATGPGKTRENIVVNKSEGKMPINRVKHKVKESSKDHKKQSRLKTDTVDTQKVVSYLSNDPCLPTLPEYGMASIEARLKRMEETLLRKIEQNSNRIVDLKNTLVISVREKKSVVTQTQEDEESHKKHLYQQISQYLSPDINSMIYEEMFLNKFTRKLPDMSSEDTKLPKRRKRR